MTDHLKETQTDLGQIVQGQHILGTASLLLATGLFVLAVMEETSGVPLDLPRFWYVNRLLWYFLTGVLFVVSYFLLRQKTSFRDSWRAPQGGIRFQRVVLYTRKECHLCDHAKDTLLKYADYLPPITEVDIDDHPEYLEKYDTCVPVVEMDGKIRFRGQVNEILLRRLIEGTPPVVERSANVSSDSS